MPDVITKATEEICDFSDLPSYCCGHCQQGSTRLTRSGGRPEGGRVLGEPARPSAGGNYMWNPRRDNFPPDTAGFVHVAGNWVDADISQLMARCPQLYMVEMAESQAYLLGLWLATLQTHGIGAQVFNRYRNGLTKP